MKRSTKHFKSVVFIVRQTWVLAYFPFATSILRTAVLYFQVDFLNAFCCQQTPCLAQAATQPHCHYQSLTGRRSCWSKIGRRKHSIDVSKYIQFFQFSCNIQTFYWEQKGELYTSFHIWLIPNKKILKKVVSWFPLVIGQNMSQLATISENIVTSAQFLVALVTSEMQFWVLGPIFSQFNPKQACQFEILTHWNYSKIYKEWSCRVIWDCTLSNTWNGYGTIWLVDFSYWPSELTYSCNK